MSEYDFQQLAVEYLESIQAETGIWLDRHFTGHSISDAYYIDISPAVSAIMRTEMALGTRVAAGTKVRFDLKELNHVTPPAAGENLFVTFMIASLSSLDDLVLAFALHFTRLQPAGPALSELQAHLFKPGTAIEEIYSVIVYALSTSGEMRLAARRILIGLGPGGELVSYLMLELEGAGGEERDLKPPSDQMMFLLFLALSAFMMVNQSEAALEETGERKARIG